MTTLDRVFVRNADGTPLAPTQRFAKVRHLLENGDATIHTHEPFTIQLTQQRENATPAPMRLGIDTGPKYAAISVHDGKREHISEQIDTLQDESKRLSKRREARRTRRHYTTWHRPPRFENRRRPAGWLPPSIQHQLDIHIKAILDMLEILPIAEVVVEVPDFDVARMADPEAPKRGYENGPQKGYGSVREYVIDRDDHRCRACGATEHLQVHHIESRLTGGNSPGNLVTLCGECHKAYHDGELELDEILRHPSLKYATQANIIGSRLVTELAYALPDDVELLVTNGRETARAREAAGLEKSHVVDARVIAGGAGVEPCGVVYRRCKVRRHNRHYYKANTLKGGKRRRSQGLSEVNGFRRFDLVLLDGCERCVVDGLRSTGYFKLKRLDGSLVCTSSASAARRDSSVSWRRLKLVRHSGGYVSWAEEA